MYLVGQIIYKFQISVHNSVQGSKKIQQTVIKMYEIY